MSDAANALFHPFAKGLLELPRPGRALFLGAEAGLGLSEDWRRALVCEQGFKPDHDRLRVAGYAVEPEASLVIEPEASFVVEPKASFVIEPEAGGAGFDLALCLLTKHRLENLANLGRAWAALKVGGTLVCAGGKDVGAASVERAFARAVGAVSSLSKYHGKVFWTERTEFTPPELAQWVEAGRLRVVPETACWSRPGLYNWDKVDAGSAFLVEHLPPDLAGRVADLGAGWGYLSIRLLDRYPDIAALHLYEADWRAVEAARANLRSPKVTFHWHDVAAGLSEANFDVVVMNPPFHHGKATDVELGRAFISAAAQALVPGGRLLMVANRQLPYEAVLATGFAKFGTTAENGLHKVMWARR